MKDEIKEISIKTPGQILDYVDTKEHLLELFNYITNLQEERDMFERMSKWSSEVMFEYKLRNEDAIEYIKTHKTNEYRNGRDDEYYLELNEDELQELLNILNGGKNE